MLVINSVVKELLVSIVCSWKDLLVYKIDHLKWSLMLISYPLSPPWIIFLMEDSIHYVWGLKDKKMSKKPLELKQHSHGNDQERGRF